MNAERPDEREAKGIVQKVLRVELEHADKNGGVDYISTDRRHAVEVTRVTDGRKRAGRDALRGSRGKVEHKGELQTCWAVFVPEKQRRLKVLLQSVHPALVELEVAGCSRFARQPATVHVIQNGPLSPIYRMLLDAGVERASAVPSHAHSGHFHQVLPVLGSGGSSNGSDEALSLLTKALGEKRDNAKKLGLSGASQRHLFVWIDDDTRYDIARPLSREALAWTEEGFRLPSMPPVLDLAITTLWVMHKGSRLGWLWDGQIWRELRQS